MGDFMEDFTEDFPVMEDIIEGTTTEVNFLGDMEETEGRFGGGGNTLSISSCCNMYNLGNRGQ